MRYMTGRIIVFVLQEVGYPGKVTTQPIQEINIIRCNRSPASLPNRVYTVYPLKKKKRKHLFISL